MTPEVLRKMGPSTLAQLARQAGLRGASVYDADALRIALGFFLADSPTEGTSGEPEEGEELGDPRSHLPQGSLPGLSVAGLPPALQTETMARLLETQGKQAEASALREGLRRGPGGQPTTHADPGDGDGCAPAPGPQGAPEEPDPRGDARDAAASPGQETPLPTVTLAVDEEQIRISWDIEPQIQPAELAGETDSGGWQIEVWIWRARGSRITRKVAITTPRGEHTVERPGDAALAAALLGQRHAGGFRPRAHTHLWRAEPLSSQSEARSTKPSRASPRSPTRP